MNDSRLKLLYVVTKLELGGAQKQLLSLISQLDQNRFNLFLFTAAEGHLLGEAQSIPGLSIRRSSFLERSINPLRDFLALIEIYYFIKESRIDIVHTHSSKAGILGRLAAYLGGVQVIIHTVHGWPFNDYQFFLIKRFYIWLERIAAKFTDKLIVVSVSDRRKGLDNHIGKDTSYQLIRYGINYAAFNIEKSYKNGEALRVGMVACFKPQKSPLDFVKLASLVIQELPGLDLKFVLVGDGILRSQVEKAIAKSGLNEKIILTGWCNDIPKFLSGIDIFVLTSLWEGLPISALEAMAASLSVIATDTGGICEVVIDKENGFLVFPRGIKKMSEKLILLLKDKTLRVSMGSKASKVLGSDFTVEKMINETKYLYEDLISKKERYVK